MDNGITIGYKDQPIIKQGDDYFFSVHTYNSSTGTPLNIGNSYCALHLYNSSGSHIVINNNISFGLTSYDFFLNILGENFSETGSYPLVVACIGNSGIGSGVCSSSLEVTPTGRDINPSLIALYFFLFFSLIGGMFLFNRNKKAKMKAEGDWDLFKMFRESIKEFRFFLNWIFITLILFFLSNFFFVFGFNLLHTISVGVFYLSLVCGIPVVIIFALQFLDVRKRCEELGDLVSWGGKGE